MTDVEKLNAEIAQHREEIARLTAWRDALEKPVSDAERWARAFQSKLHKKSPVWANFDDLNENLQADLTEVMQHVIDGIRSEADCALANMAAQRDRLKLKVDSQREELRRWNDAHSMGPNQTRDKLVEQAQEIQTMTADRDALKTQVDALATRSAGLEAERDALAARVQKVGVAFDVTAEELGLAYANDMDAFDFKKFAMHYLAEHATVVTPEPPGDLPSVEALAKIYWQSMDAHPTINGCHVAGISAVLAHLRPWLRPRTITRADLDTAARVITTQRVVDENSTLADTARGIAQDVFAAVGITVEGER